MMIEGIQLRTDLHVGFQTSVGFHLQHHKLDDGVTESNQTLTSPKE
jgi:hypothetical protein